MRFLKRGFFNPFNESTKYSGDHNTLQLNLQIPVCSLVLWLDIVDMSLFCMPMTHSTLSIVTLP